MKRKSILACLVVTMLTISCTHTYKEYDKDSFLNYTWSSGQEVTFSPTIEDISKSYKLTLGMRHLYGFPLHTMSVTVTSVSPSGKKTTKNYDFDTKDSEGNYIARCSGDLCDLETIIEQDIKFEEAGEYKYRVTHNIQTVQVPGVMEFGLIIDAVE